MENGSGNDWISDDWLVNTVGAVVMDTEIRFQANRLAEMNSTNWSRGRLKIEKKTNAMPAIITNWVKTIQSGPSLVLVYWRRMLSIARYHTNSIQSEGTLSECAVFRLMSRLQN